MLANNTTLEDVRCRRCSRLLFKSTPDALKAGALLEHKCGHCGAMNTLTGDAA